MIAHPSFSHCPWRVAGRLPDHVRKAYRAKSMADAISHDQNFKNLIVDYPREALSFFASEEAPLPGDEVRITPVRQEQMQERLGTRFRELDTPLLVEWTDGRRAAVVFAMEHESDAPRFSPPRLARYCLDLHELLGTERVVPVTIFLRDAGGAPRPLVLRTERRPYLTFDYLACAIGEMPAERWLESGNLVARVNLPNMRGGDASRVEVYGQAVRGLLELEPDGNRRAKYLDFIDIYANLTDNERERYTEQYPEENKVMAGIVQTAREEGIEQGIERGIERGIEQGIEQGVRQGIEQGMQRGRIDGERTVLERLLRRRFGPLSPEVTARLGEAAGSDIETWAERVLDADTLDDVFNSSH